MCVCVCVCVCVVWQYDYIVEFLLVETFCLREWKDNIA